MNFNKDELVIIAQGMHLIKNDEIISKNIGKEAQNILAKIKKVLEGGNLDEQKRKTILL